MFKLTIETNNAAFEPYPEMETARILREIADVLEGAANAGTATDINGNAVGKFYLEV